MDVGKGALGTTAGENGVSVAVGTCVDRVVCVGVDVVAVTA